MECLFGIKSPICAIDKTKSTKSPETNLDKVLLKHSKEILKIKQNFKSIDAEVKWSLFNLPLRFFAYIIESVYFKDTKKSVSIETIAKNRKDYDWMKDLKQNIGQGRFITFRCFNEDLISINKCLVSIFKHEFEEDDQEEENTYSFLSDKSKFDSDNVDFTDKGALLKRQRDILEEIELHKKQKEALFNPFSILRSGLKLWFIILWQGGKFCIAKIQEDKIVDHKSDSKYVQRK